MNTSRTLLDLSNELISHIRDSLDDFDDLRDLRLAGNARLSACALRVMQQRTPTIYIEPSKASLDHFQMVCNSPAHAKAIKEVKYVASIRSLSAEELRQTREFQDAVTKLSASEEAMYDVLVQYDAEKAEQDALVDSGEFRRTLAERLKLMPRLETIVLCAEPQRRGYALHEHKFREACQRGRTYNRLRRWQYSDPAKTQEASKGLHEGAEGSYTERVHNGLLYTAQFRMYPGALDGMRLIWRPLWIWQSSDQAHR